MQESVDVIRKVALSCSNGASIPQDIPGKCFKDRIDEWHRQIVTGQLMYSVLSHDVSDESQHILHLTKSIPTCSCRLRLLHMFFQSTSTLQASNVNCISYVACDQTNERKAEKPHRRNCRRCIAKFDRKST